MKNLFIFITFVLVNAFALNAENKIITINTNHTTLIYAVDQTGKLNFQYYGKRINDVTPFAGKKLNTQSSARRDVGYEAYPANGYGNINEPALSVIHHDGSMITELQFVKSTVDLNHPGMEHSVIYLKDRFFDFEVELHAEAFQSEDVVTQWVVISHREPLAVSLQNFFSSFLNIYAKSYYLTHFSGAWANEMSLTEEKLENGIKVIESKKGVRTTQTDNSAFIISVGQPATETFGECYGGALAWSGNYKMVFQNDEWQHLSILGGINPYLSEYHLQPKERFKTPKMIYTYSSAGKGQISRNLHDWARKYSLANGDKLRPVVLNSWEGAYFTFDESTLTGMMDNAAAFGIEMFVLDDGWFGNKYPRDNDKAGLGDWQTNLKKLPHGINYLTDYARSKGVRFGLWVEPEMVNPKSILAETHPEWIVQSPGRDKLQLRNQLLLDLSNPKVQDFIWNTIDSLLINSPGIAYIKWDANRHVEQAGSTYLSSGKQTHFWIDYTKGLYSIYEKIRAKYPQIMLQDCSSGGGRLDFGSLRYHDEFWASDDTDPLQRLFIQYGTNMIYPPVATAAHVSTSPNHQTGLVSPLKFRFDVAMTGRMGMELQPKDITGNDSVFAIQAIRNYKVIRPLIAYGDLYRLVSPYEEGGWVSLMYVAKDKKSAVLFAYSIQPHNRGVLPLIKLNGLLSDQKYKIVEINNGSQKGFYGNDQIFSAEYLMNAGIELNISKQYDSAVFEILLAN